jgi:hypothetical protein
MILNIFLYVYCLPLLICCVSAAWFQWFSADQKASLGALMALIIGFIPLANVWWSVMAIHDIPMEIKAYLKKKKQQKEHTEWLQTVTTSPKWERTVDLDD